MRWSGQNSRKIEPGKIPNDKKKVGTKYQQFICILSALNEYLYREKMSELWTWIYCIFPVTAKNAVLALDHKEQIPTIK